MKSVLTRFFVSLAIAISTGDSLSAMATQEISQHEESLLRKVSSSSELAIPIIVRFKSDVSVAQKLGKIEAKLSKSELANQPSLGSKIDTRRSFKYAPLAAMYVNVDELNQLIRDPDLEVFEDTIKYPLLAGSVPAVYPSQNTSTFHGNNEWVVAVLDSGVEKSHSFLSSKVVSEACYSDGGGQPGSTSLCPAEATSSVATGSGVNCDVQGCEHGTQVAGIAAGNGQSFDGVARDANLISIQVYSQFNDEAICGLGSSACIGAYTSDIIAALERVFELRNSFKIAAVNLSLGSSELFSGSCDDQPEANIIAQLKSAGVAVVAATGNAANTSQMQSPACISDTIAVAASTNDGLTAWSGNNISNQVDLFAPGIAINSSALDNGFVAGTGTSLAAPHVSGALAVMKHAKPNLTVQESESLLKSVGPSLTQHTVTRRRLALTDALAIISSQPPVTSDELCFPVKQKSGVFSLVCL